MLILYNPCMLHHGAFLAAAHDVHSLTVATGDDFNQVCVEKPPACSSPKLSAFFVSSACRRNIYAKGVGTSKCVAVSLGLCAADAWAVTGSTCCQSLLMPRPSPGAPLVHSSSISAPICINLCLCKHGQSSAGCAPRSIQGKAAS